MEHMDPGATSKLFLRWERPWWRYLARRVGWFSWLYACQTELQYLKSAIPCLEFQDVKIRRYPRTYTCLNNPPKIPFAHNRSPRHAVNRKALASPSPGPQMSSSSGAKMIGRRASTASLKSRGTRTCSWRGSPAHRRERWMACQTKRNEKSSSRGSAENVIKIL